MTAPEVAASFAALAIILFVVFGAAIIRKLRNDGAQGLLPNILGEAE